MKRPKTVRELRHEILHSEVLRTKPQEAISHSVSMNQGTLSRILRGHFKRRSGAVERVCRYAHISSMTDQPKPELETSLDQLARIARRGSPNDRRAMRLIRLAAELLERDAPPRNK